MKRNQFYKLLPIILITTVAALLRFWRIEHLTTFLGDQGFDFLIVKRMIIDGNFTLLGPKIGPYNDLGNLYLGPAYYYLLAPSLALSGLDPLGPAVQAAIFSVATVVVVYFLAREFLSEKTALLSSTLYALNPFIIEQSRAASNPHFIPFFAVLCIYSNFKMTISRSKSAIWPVICGISLGIIFQLHYIAISLIIAIFFYLAIKKEIKKLLITLLSFFVAVSPQLAFEIKHDFFITKLFLKQLQNGENLLSVSTFSSQIVRSLETISHTSFLSGSSATPLVLLVFFALIFVLSFSRKEKVIKFLLSTILLAVILTSLYPGSIEPHYFSVIYAQITLLIAFGIISLWENRTFLIKIVAVSAMLILFFNYMKNNNLDTSSGYTMPAGWDLIGVKKASRFISEDVGNDEKFNIAATIDGDTRARPYRYLVEVYGKDPQDVEKYPDSEIIYLISRDEEEAIKRYTVWEIASFMPFEIQKKWEIQNNIKLYKLTKKKE